MNSQITSLLSILVSAFFAFIHFEKNTKKYHSGTRIKFVSLTIVFLAIM